ncbi:MAG: TIGR03013 family PEP-CTERM/XrtA system glycosyltransferase [Nitrospiraceae bacterium]|nr:MAG: TIGR03013 family PEP-CTERM/XrtA system glycosyltransferase [Nitrospiraceae bacterium]
MFLSFAAVYGGAFLRFSNNHDLLMREYASLPPKAAVFSIAVILMVFFTDLYDAEPNDKKGIFSRIVIGNSLAFVALGTFYYFIPFVKIGRGILFLSICLAIIVQTLWHIGYALFLKLPAMSSKVLILGAGPVALTMGNLFAGNSRNNNGLKLAGYVNCTGETIRVPRNNVIGESASLLEIALNERVHKIIVSLSERRGSFPVRELLNCKLQGIDIIEGPSFYEQITGKLLIENMNPSHFIFSDGFRITALRRYVKRAADVIFSSAGLILSIPLFLILSIIIKLDSKGPVLFRQKRVGEGERPFIIYKFRTMVEDAERDSGPVWSSKGDSRITRVGRFLRKTRLDEIPQLFNVFSGDMSFIGPRPERPFFVESLKKQIPYYSERHCIKPGVTGWAQVKYQYGDSMEDAIEKLRYDLYYIKYQSLLIDLLIVLSTVKVIFFGRGGR